MESAVVRVSVWPNKRLMRTPVRNAYLLDIVDAAAQAERAP
jgi:hypothetical protein